MRRRYGKRGRGRKRKGPWHNKPIPVPRRVEILNSPEVRLLMQTGQALFEYLMAKVSGALPPGLVGDENLAEINAEIRAAIEAEMAKGHPEATEPIETKINERQEGRSEVVREIARPKPG
jgi:hypothetical protein